MDAIVKAIRMIWDCMANLQQAALICFTRDHILNSHVAHGDGWV